MEPINTPPDAPTQFNETHRDSLKDLGQNLYADLNQLWQREGLLVRTEISEKIDEVKTASSALFVGGALLLVGVFSLVATAIIVLDLYVALWAAATIVTLVILVFGAILFQGGKKNLQLRKLKPIHSIDAFGEIRSNFQEKFHEYKKH